MNNKQAMSRLNYKQAMSGVAFGRVCGFCAPSQPSRRRLRRHAGEGEPPAPLLRLWDENHLPTTSVRLALHLGLEVVDVEG
jgi:hypothetical protein